MGLFDSLFNNNKKTTGHNLTPGYGAVYGPTMPQDPRFASSRTAQPPLTQNNTLGRGGSFSTGGAGSIGGGGGGAGGVGDQPRFEPTPVDPVDLGGGGGAGGGGGQVLGDRTSLDSLKNSLTTSVGDLQQRVVDRNNPLIEEGRNLITDSNRAIFDALDRQIGVENRFSGLSADEVAGTDRGGRVLDEYNTAIGGAGNERDTQLRGLDSLVSGVGESRDLAIEGVEGQRAAALEKQQLRQDEDRRLLAEQARSANRSFQGQLGAAGDSSASRMGGEAITRQTLKETGRLLGFGQQIMADIDAVADQGVNTARKQYQEIVNAIGEKKMNVANIFEKAVSSLNTWKVQTLNSVVTDAEGRLNELQNAKATATADQAAKIADMEFQIKQGMVQQLTQLDTYLSEQNYALDQWQMQRSAGLEDYAKQLQMAAQYSGGKSVDPVKLGFHFIPDPTDNKKTLKVAYDLYSGETVSTEEVGYSELPPAGTEKRGFFENLFNR